MRQTEVLIDVIELHDVAVLYVKRHFLVVGELKGVLFLLVHDVVRQDLPIINCFSKDWTRRG